jgi:hypothetical protein
VHPSTHYYVLSLGVHRTALYEAFRDELIEVENKGFPVMSPSLDVEAGELGRRNQFMRAVDKCFASYDSQEPLSLVLVGDRELQTAFDTVTVHGAAVVGRIHGDRSVTLARDLGSIVWPVMKERISGALDRVLRELEESSQNGRVVSGLEAVVAATAAGAEGTLLVEDDYRMKGSLATSRQHATVLREVDVRDVFDDAVDALIEKVLESGGNAIFVPTGTLADRGRIALLLREPEVS